LLVLALVLGGLMVSKVRYTSFKNVGTGRKTFYLILLVGAAGMLMWLYSQYVLLALSVIYVSHGVIWYLAGLLKSKSRTEEVPEISSTSN
jgi:phosphatidylserine synthase